MNTVLLAQIRYNVCIIHYGVFRIIRRRHMPPLETPEYERRRCANINRNNEKLRSLGLYTSLKPAPPLKPAPARKRDRQPKQ